MCTDGNFFLTGMCLGLKSRAPPLASAHPCNRGQEIPAIGRDSNPQPSPKSSPQLFPTPGKAPRHVGSKPSSKLWRNSVERVPRNRPISFGFLPSFRRTPEET